MTGKQSTRKPGGGRGTPAVMIRQPQASAVLTRTGPSQHPGWQTDYRGPLLIHAAKRGPGDPPVNRAGGMVYGALLGVVELVDCLRTEREGGGPDEAGFVWVLANPRSFASPIPYIGRMGLFDVADAIIADALAGLGPHAG